MQDKTTHLVLANNFNRFLVFQDNSNALHYVSIAHLAQFTHSGSVPSAKWNQLASVVCGPDVWREPLNFPREKFPLLGTQRGKKRMGFPLQHHQTSFSRKTDILWAHRPHFSVINKTHVVKDNTLKERPYSTSLLCA